MPDFMDAYQKDLRIRDKENWLKTCGDIYKRYERCASHKPYSFIDCYVLYFEGFKLCSKLYAKNELLNLKDK